MQALTALDFLESSELVKQAWECFTNVQTKDEKYAPFIGPEDQPAVEFNKEKMEKFLPGLRKYYFEAKKYRTYLEQLGIQYPTVKK